MVLLILRSAVDIFSAQQIPAIFAVSIDLLTLAYVAVSILTGQRVYTSRFLWLFAGWVAFQGLWVILLPLGGLGLGASHFSISLREWVRLFSWLMVYLLIMQLKDRLHPAQIVTALFCSTVLPLLAAALQMVLPASALPAFLAHRGNAFTDLENASRINGTLGHPNAFVTFLILFLALSYWQATSRKQQWPWYALMGVLTFFIVGTKALVGLVMLVVLIVMLIAPKLTLSKLLGSTVLIGLALIAFGSTEFGRERLSLFVDMPFFNADLDVSRAILLRQTSINSFYWRLEQWTFLLKAWQQHPWLGYGFDSPRYLTHFGSAAHNDYIRSLVEGGIVGFIAFITFIGAHAVRLFRIFVSQLSTVPQRNLAWTLLSVLIAMTVGMLTENIWSHTALFFYWLSLTAVVSFDWRSKSELHESFVE
ncbi:MAG: O-antigen ligase family protein [Cyanobacteria bacterium J06648_16]